MYVYSAQVDEIFQVYIDKEDIERVQEHKWYILIPGNSRTRYAVNDSAGKLHRFLLGEKNPAILIDHIDRNGLNNRKTNLRRVSNSTNKKNMDAWSTSATGINGVSYEPPRGKNSGRYRATWTDYDGRMHLKSFSEKKYPNAFELAVAYRKQMEERYGYTVK